MELLVLTDEAVTFTSQYNVIMKVVLVNINTFMNQNYNFWLRFNFWFYQNGNQDQKRKVKKTNTWLCTIL